MITDRRPKIQIKFCHHGHCSEFSARGYKTFFMLNSVEYEILNAHKYKKNIKKFGLYSVQMNLKCYFSRS